MAETTTQIIREDPAIEAYRTQLLEQVNVFMQDQLARHNADPNAQFMPPDYKVALLSEMQQKAEDMAQRNEISREAQDEFAARSHHRAAAAIAAGDLTQRVPVRQADDEVTSLSRSRNTMLSRIESSFAVRERSEERMREFVADASHELRTPLATVRGYAELYRQGAVSEPAAVASAMERIEAESSRMSGLVEDLLTLARLDDAPQAEVGSVDLTVLAADAVADARVRAPQRRIGLLGIEGPLGPTVVRGSEPRLRQVVTNLVANAMRHTPEGTPVEIAVGPSPDGVVLEVRDHGPGVPADVATKVFERCYRADPSRGRTAGGGSGLGLAIVAAIVGAHGGRVGVAETPGGGATFVVRLPQRAPSN